VHLKEAWSMELKETMPLQEISEKIGFKDENKPTSPAKVIKEQLDRKYFDPYEINALAAWQNIPKADRDKFFNTVRAIPLADMLRATNPRTASQVNPHLKEFLASSGTSGIGGAYYLIPVKLWDQMQNEAVEADITGAISKQVLGPESIPGTTMKVDIAVDGEYIFNESSSGAIAPTETISTTQATLDFSTIYTINFRIGNDLLEDCQFDLISMHVSEAGRQAGEKASTLAATILYTAPDGDGTVNAVTSGQAYSTWIAGGTTGVEDAIAENLADGFAPDTMLVTHKAMLYKIVGSGGAAGNAGDALTASWLMNGWPQKIGCLNMVYSDISYLNAAAAKAVVFAKEFALLTGRKRWLRVENYSEPVKDLTGAVISFRQDSISLYKDAICTYTESS
jgi:hypothetical protein